MSHSVRTEDFDVPGPLTVTVRTEGTHVALSPSADPHRCHVRLTGSDPHLDLQAAVITCENGELVVEVPTLLSSDGRPGLALQLGGRSFSRGGARAHTTLEVHVPAHGRASITTESGDVVVGVDVEEARITTGAGAVRVGRAVAAEIRTGSGDIALDDVGEARLQSGSGDVTVRTVGRAELTTASGDIRVSRCEGHLTASTASGDLDVAAAGGDVTGRTVSGDLTVRGIARGKVTAATVSGDLCLTVRGGVPVWTDLTTVSGDVANGLSPRGEPAEGQEFVEVVARTVSGDLSLADA